MDEELSIQIEEYRRLAKKMTDRQFKSITERISSKISNGNPRHKNKALEKMRQLRIRYYTVSG